MDFEGKTVEIVREMTEEEHERLGWYKDNLGGPLVLELADGTVIFPAMDPEMNGAGAWRGMSYSEMEELEGETIHSVFPMSDAYMDHLGWGDMHGIKSTVVSFDEDNDRAIYTSRDPEGNDYGVFHFFEDDEVYALEFTAAN